MTLGEENFKCIVYRRHCFFLTKITYFDVECVWIIQKTSLSSLSQCRNTILDNVLDDDDCFCSCHDGELYQTVGIMNEDGPWPWPAPSSTSRLPAQSMAGNRNYSFSTLRSPPWPARRSCWCCWSQTIRADTNFVHLQTSSWSWKIVRTLFDAKTRETPKYRTFEPML